MAEGNLSTPIRVGAQDEIGILAENLDIMRGQLKNALEQAETAKRDLEIRVYDRTRQLQELVRRVLMVQEEERHRVALELHDETAQSISALAVALDSVLRHQAALTPEDTSRLQEAREIATNMLEAIRRLIYALRPVALQEMGLAAALHWYAEEYLERTGVEVAMSVKGDGPRVPGHVELVLYRIGQEALNNVAKHARAKHVHVTVERRDSLVSLTIQDDGVGFDPGDPSHASSPTGGIGLAGMRERAALVQGRLTITSSPGGGARIGVEVPVFGNE